MGIGGTFKEKLPGPPVIIDNLMPVKEGLETIRELKQDCPNVYIIAISGGGDYHMPSKT